MDSDDILAILDRAAQDFTFPMLDNGYIYPACARMSLYRSPDDWALVLETFGYSPRAGQPDCMITTFASRPANRRPPSAFVSAAAHAEYLARDPHFEQRFVEPIDQDDLYDEDCFEFVSASVRHLNLRGQAIPVPDLEAVRAAGIMPEEDRLLVFELARYLAHQHRDLVLATPAERTLNVPEGAEQVALFDDWRHPDLVREEWPSETASFCAIAALLAGEPHELAAITAGANTHWSHWPEGGRL
jgi:hypothetical protein